MRNALSILISSLALAACVSTPNDTAAGASTKTPAPSPALDPERITKLDFYGGRCVGEPSMNGVEGVTGAQLDVGLAFVAELYLSAGTGFAWTARGYDESIVTLAEERTRPVRGTDAVGAKQMHTMNFKALKPGKTTITFELKRPWESTTPPAEVRRTTIYVK